MDGSNGRDVTGYHILALGEQAAIERWPVLAPILARAVELSLGRFTMDDLRDCVQAGAHVVLVVVTERGEITGAMTAYVVEYPRLRAFEVVFLAGDDWAGWGQQMLDAIDLLAFRAGCAKIEFKGRKGWGRVLAPNGYREYCVSFEKEVPCPAQASSGPTVEMTSTVH